MQQQQQQQPEAKTKRMGKYELGRVIGTGNFSKVRIATDTETTEVFAVKVIDKALLARDRLEEQLKREIAVMKALRHRHVVSMREVLQTTRHIYIVLELVTGGDLFDKIVQLQRFSEDVARRYFQHLILGVRYVHAQNIAHRDLKPENLLLDENNVLKISDFGLANLQHVGLMSTVCGTPNYVAPEVIKDRGYNGFAADVWSCGIILYVMLSGHQAFDDKDIKVLFSRIERGEYRMSRHFSDGARSLISKILVVDPERRYTIRDIIAHPWFQVGFDPSDLASGGEIAVSNMEVNKSLQTVDDVPISPQTANVHQGEDAFRVAQRMMNASIQAGIMNSQQGPMPDEDPQSPQHMGQRAGSTVGSHRWFFLRLTVEAAFNDICLALAQLIPTFRRPPAQTNDIRGYFTTPQGTLLTYQMELISTCVPGLTLVEVKKGRGDVLGYNEFLRLLHVTLGPQRMASMDTSLQ